MESVLKAQKWRLMRQQWKEFKNRVQLVFLIPLLLSLFFFVACYSLKAAEGVSSITKSPTDFYWVIDGKKFTSLENVRIVKVVDDTQE